MNWRAARWSTHHSEEDGVVRETERVVGRIPRRMLCAQRSRERVARRCGPHCLVLGCERREAIENLLCEARMWQPRNVLPFRDLVQWAARRISIVGRIGGQPYEHPVAPGGPEDAALIEARGVLVVIASRGDDVNEQRRQCHERQQRMRHRWGGLQPLGMPRAAPDSHTRVVGHWCARSPSPSPSPLTPHAKAADGCEDGPARAAGARAAWGEGSFARRATIRTLVRIAPAWRATRRKRPLVSAKRRSVHAAMRRGRRCSRGVLRWAVGTHQCEG